MTVAARTCAGSTLVEISSGPARWWGDLAPGDGGGGLHPTPQDLLDSALASCSVLTLQRYARRKRYPLHAAQVRVERDRAGPRYRVRRRVELIGPLTADQRQELLRVVDACGIRQAMREAHDVQTELVG